jgi:mRNA interferase RelE/StbE
MKWRNFLAWIIEFAPAAIKELKKLDPLTARRILDFLQERIAQLENPRATGEALTGNKLGDFWKYRLGEWRVIAKIEDAKVVILVLRIGNRRHVYK